jgi:hypothetical protein
MSAPVAKRQSSEKAALSERGILQHVLSFVGAGQHAFVAPVSQSWWKAYSSAYSSVPHKRKRGVVGPLTMHSAIFSSPSRVQMAFATGVLPVPAGLATQGPNGPRLKANACDRLLAIAGKHADLATLQTAHELGLKLSEDMCCAAAASGALDKLQWLATQRSLPRHIARFAAQSGNVEMLTFIKQLGLEFDLECYKEAASGNHLQVIQYLHAEGCAWDTLVCTLAAGIPNLTMLQWLRENDCPWDAHRVVLNAAYTGNMDMILYLQQQPDVPFDEMVMQSAAIGGNLELCKFLRANDCPWDARATSGAKDGDSMELLTWLRANGCDWDAADTALRAIAYKKVALLRYCFDNTAARHWTAHQLTKLLACAGAVAGVELAKVLREHGAEWPVELCHRSDTDEIPAYPPAVWPAAVVAWARSEGCTSPLPAEEEYVEEEDNADIV